MDQFAEIQDLIGGLLWVILPAGLSLILVVMLGVVLIVKKRVPLALHPLPLALPALAGWLFWAWTVWGGSGGAEDTLASYSTVSLVRLTVFMLTMPLAGITLICCAVAGARHQPRRLDLAGIGTLVVLCTCALTLFGAVEETLLFGQVRAACYAGVGWMVGLAMLSGGKDEDTGPDAAATAGICFAMVVGTGEAAVRGLFEYMALGGLQALEQLDKRPGVVDQFYAVVAPEMPFTWAALLLSIGVGVLGLVIAFRRGRTPAQVVSAGVWLLVPILLLVSNLGAARLTELALALP